MNPAAMTSCFLTGGSSKARLADAEIVVSRGGLIQRIVASCLARAVHSHESFLKLTDALISSAEQSYMRRDVDVLQELSSVLMNLPLDGPSQIGLYYHGLAINRSGDRSKAEVLLGTVADHAPITYRARAIQTLGANYHDKGHLDEALRFQLEALRMASDRAAHGLLVTLLAQLEMATVSSLKGDHKGALAVLESISPLVQIVSQQNPLYYYFYYNELAVEFGELNRIAEAEAASAIALASPFAPAYPEWAETRQELEAKRSSATPSVVAFSRTPEAELSADLKSQRKPESLRKLAFGWLTGDRDSFQISVLPFPATATNALTATSIRERVLICTGPRAPPPLF